MDEANELRGSLQLIGTVKSVIFQNEENGYTVLRLDVGGDEPVTVVGCLPFAAPGEGLTVEGAWERHPSHGEQFKASSAMRSLPVGEKHIYEYLASGAVRGIGPATAAVLVNRFGSRTLEILSDSPEKLAEIKGISARRARDISETFRRQTGMRLLMEFLAANGLKPEYAMRLYKLYGDGALELVKSNPYVIASDRIGGQFDEADALALSLGFEEDSPPRIAAALIFEMVHNLNNGHSFLPREKLVAATAQLIGVEAEAAEECLDVLADEGEIVQEVVAGVHRTPFRPRKTWTSVSRSWNERPACAMPRSRRRPSASPASGGCSPSPAAPAPAKRRSFRPYCACTTICSSTAFSPRLPAAPPSA